MTIPVDYDGLDLQAGNYRVTRLDVYSAAPRSLQNESLAKQDGSLTVYTKYEAKQILVEGQIKANTQSSLEIAIDTLKTALNKFERKLTIGYRSGERVFICTQSNVSVTRDRGGSTYANYSIEFFSPQPFGIDEDDQTFIDTTTTLGSTTFSINNQGSYKAEPVITITLDGLESAEGAQFSLGNPVLSQRVILANNWVDGDTIVIDCLEKQVFINGILSNFSGRIPEWSPGTGSVEWVDSFTGRSVSINAQYQRKYL